MTDLSMYDRVEKSAAMVRSRCGALPETAIVLGSGLGDFAGTLVDAVTMPYGDLPYWPASRVVGHEGQLVIGNVSGTRVAALSGRAHFYEGHDLGTVVFATRVMGRIGVRRLILTNAAGGINTGFAQGALMIIDDHINMLGSNPLIGMNDDRFGTRFPDMSEVYSARLRQIADDAARAKGVPVSHGIYIACMVRVRTPAENPVLPYHRRPTPVACRRSRKRSPPRQMGIEVWASRASRICGGCSPATARADEVMETARRVRGSSSRCSRGL